MVRRLRPHLTYANVVATLCLFIVLGGTGYAASKISGKRIKTRSIAQRALKDHTIGRGKIRAHTLTGAQIRADSLGNAEIANGGLEAAHATTADRAARASEATHADDAAHATDATHAETATAADNSSHAETASSADDATKLGGTAAGEYRRFDSTLPSGKSESGDFGIRVPAPAASTGFIAQSVTFPTPLTTRIPGANVVYTALPSTNTHCTGPGQAEAGFLCIYEINNVSITDPPDVFAFENPSPQAGSGNFGFNMEWDVTGANPFATGTWTVTAP